MGMIESGWVKHMNAIPAQIKPHIKHHYHQYNTNEAYNAAHNEKIWKCFAPHKDGNGAISKNGSWIAFGKALAAAQLDAALSDHDQYGRWDAMNGWN